MSSPGGGGPLAGVRVVEFGNLVAAPFCGMLLSDLGAEVVKVEPLEGDMSRQLGPFLAGESAFFHSVNRGKRSLAADLRSAEVLPWILELVADSDVVVHNFRKGVAERLGIGYDDLAPSSPGLVYCAISAFGPEGPSSDRAGIDLIFHGESGMMSITGEEGQVPQKTATNVADVYAGTNAALAVAAALHERERTGNGARIDVSLRDGIIAMQATWNALFFATGVQPPRLGTASPFTAPTQAFRTADGRLLLAIVTDRHWERLCKVLSLPTHVCADPDFSSNELRVTNRERVARVVESVLRSDTTEAWLARLSEAGLPAGRILDFEEVFSDEQVLHSGMKATYRRPNGEVTVTGTPFWLDGAKALAERHPPLLGEHSSEVLAELGCPAEVRDRLLIAGLVTGP